jgi:hypothetical protein
MASLDWGEPMAPGPVFAWNRPIPCDAPTAMRDVGKPDTGDRHVQLERGPAGEAPRRNGTNNCRGSQLGLKASDVSVEEPPVAYRSADDHYIKSSPPDK